MARVNLSIEDGLFKKIEDDAKSHSSTVNVHIISVLEGLYSQYPFSSDSIGLVGKLYEANPFNYSVALQQLIDEAEAKPDGEEFTLFELESFSGICVAKAQDADIKPSIVRARLGKMFNSWVQSNDGSTVIKRQRNKSGDLKFKSRAAVYVIDRGKTTGGDDGQRA